MIGFEIKCVHIDFYFYCKKYVFIVFLGNHSSAYWFSYLISVMYSIQGASSLLPSRSIDKGVKSANNTLSWLPSRTVKLPPPPPYSSSPFTTTLPFQNNFKIDHEIQLLWLNAKEFNLAIKASLEILES